MPEEREEGKNKKKIEMQTLTLIFLGNPSSPLAGLNSLILEQTYFAQSMNSAWRKKLKNL